MGPNELSQVLRFIGQKKWFRHKFNLILLTLIKICPSSESMLRNTWRSYMQRERVQDSKTRIIQQRSSQVIDL